MRPEQRGFARCQAARSLFACTGIFGAALLLSLPVGATTALATGRQVRDGGEEDTLPRKGETLFEGTVTAAPWDVAAPEGTFNLRATKETEPDGTVTTLLPPREVTVRYTAATRLSLPDAARRAAHADIDYGATVGVVGKANKSGMTARAVAVEAGPFDPLGKNLLPPTDDKKSWHGWIEPGVADGSIDPAKDEPGVLVATVRKTDGIPFHAKIALTPPLTNSKTYTLRFRVRTDSPRLMTVDSRQGPMQYANIGVHRVVPVDQTWRVYRETFRAANIVSDRGYVLDFLTRARTANR